MVEIKNFIVYNLQVAEGIKDEYRHLSFDNWDKTEDTDGVYIKSGLGFASRLGKVSDHDAWLMMELKYDSDYDNKISPQTFIRFYREDGAIEAGYNLDDGAIFRLKKSF